jgi:hypothetical protein
MSPLLGSEPTCYDVRYPVVDRVITQGAAQTQLRLDDGQFALRSFQPRASSVRNVQALVVYSALRRRYPVSWALQVGNGVLLRLRPRAFLARSLRQLPGETGRLVLLPS